MAVLPRRRPRGPFDPEPQRIWPSLKPALTVMLASALTLVPIIASFPLLPPFGLLMLLAWRLAREEALPVWSPLLLGLFDDLLSGQPFGSAMLLWTLTFVAIDLFDTRLVARDFWQDWLIAGGGIAGVLIVSRLIAAPLGAHVDTLLLLQIAVSVMLYPVAALIVAWTDRERSPT